MGSMRHQKKCTAAQLGPSHQPFYHSSVPPLLARIRQGGVPTNAHGDAGPNIKTTTKYAPYPVPPLLHTSWSFGSHPRCGRRTMRCGTDIRLPVDVARICVGCTCFEISATASILRSSDRRALSPQPSPVVQSLCNPRIGAARCAAANPIFVSVVPHDHCWFRVAWAKRRTSQGDKAVWR